MKWLEYAFNALVHGTPDPFLVMAVVVLAFGYLQHDQSKRALKTIERLALRTKKP